jgi:type IV secretory pathway TrbL component
MVTAGAIALAPAVVAPPSEITATPTVHVENIALTGIGQDIYYAITPVVQGAVAWAQYGVSWIPVIGPPIASQIYINYFQGIQPIVQATVNYAADVLHNPLAFFPITSGYGNTLFGIGYTYVSAQLNFFGLPGLPPIVAATRAAATPAKAAASGPADVPAAVKSVVSARLQAGAEIRAAVTSARNEVRQEVKSAVSQVRAVAATGTPAEVRDAAQQAGSEISGAVKSARSEVRSTVKTARSEVHAAVKAAHDSVKVSADAAD